MNIEFPVRYKSTVMLGCQNNYLKGTTVAYFMINHNLQFISIFGTVGGGAIRRRIFTKG